MKKKDEYALWECEKCGSTDIKGLDEGITAVISTGDLGEQELSMIYCVCQDCGFDWNEYE